MKQEEYQFVRSNLVPQVSGGHSSWSDKMLREAMMNPCFYPFVVSVDDHLIGYAELHLLHHPTRGYTGRIERVVIDHDHRGNGLATELCARLLAVAADRGCAYVELKTESETACGLYEKLGFTPQPRTNIYRKHFDHS